MGNNDNEKNDDHNDDRAFSGRNGACRVLAGVMPATNVVLVSILV